MTRRLASATLLTAVGLLVLASAAEAVSNRTRLCISAARTARRACVKQCTDDFSNTFASCFGPGADCAAGCIREQSECLLDPVAARTACQRDTDPNATGVFPEGACSVRLRDALECCGDATCTAQEGRLDPDPIQCASIARLNALQCTNDCEVFYAPQIQGCNTQFNDCTQACASCRRASDCPFAQSRRRR
jgi:hypothetical protein